MFESSWQDIILTIGNIIFLIALLPSILSVDKPSKWTSLITSVTLTIFTIVYFTLGLSYACIATGLSALGWWVLFFQKIALFGSDRV